MFLTTGDLLAVIIVMVVMLSLLAYLLYKIEIKHERYLDDYYTDYDDYPADWMYLTPDMMDSIAKEDSERKKGKDE